MKNLVTHKSLVTLQYEDRSAFDWDKNSQLECVICITRGVMTLYLVSWAKIEIKLLITLVTHKQYENRSVLGWDKESHIIINNPIKNT